MKQFDSTVNLRNHVL